MADNVTLPGTGEVVATDDIGGIQYQFMKLADGTLGSENRAVVASNGNLGAAPVIQSGSFTVTSTSSSSGTLSTEGVNCIALNVDNSVTGSWQVTAQWSIDGTNWFSLPLDRYNSQWAYQAHVSSGAINNSPTGQIYIGEVKARYVRFRCVSYTSGTDTVRWWTAAYPYENLGAFGAARMRDVKVYQDTASSLLTTATSVGNVASGSSDSGNPVKIGGIVATGAEAVVTNAQRINTRHDKAGRLVVQPYQHRERVGSQVTTITSTTETTIVTAQGASTFTDLTHLSLFNSSATTVVATLRQQATGTIRGNYVVPAGGGVVINFPAPLVSTASNQDWTITLSGSASSIYVNANYIINL